MATKMQYRLKGKSKDSYLELVLEFPLAILHLSGHD